MQNNPNDIILFLVVTTSLILVLSAFTITIIYYYQKKQISYRLKMGMMKVEHEKSLISAQLEIQENTFQHISREIHDNISLSLTLAKLNLNTFDWSDPEKASCKLNSSIQMLSRAITDLSNISKSLNSEVITSQGLIKALENEIARIQQTGIIIIYFTMTGEPVYMDTHRELLVFRIIQEAFNNIIKHAQAKQALLTLHYTDDHLHINISDNGIGFTITEEHTKLKSSAGLKNMQARAKMIGGTMQMNSDLNNGTSLLFTIPIK